MKKLLRLCVAMALMLSFNTAHADWISVYGAAKLDSVNGTGSVFENLDPGMAGGVEAGIELLGMDLWGEAVWMADSQAMYSGNFGFDLTFGSDLRVNVGLYTGPIFFQMGEAESESVTLSSETNDILNAARMANPEVPTGADIESAYNTQFGAQSGEIESLAIGWNLYRARLQVEYQVLPFGYLGLGGQFGQHLTLSGDDMTNLGKELAIEELASSDELKDLPADLKAQFINQLKQDLGVEETDSSDMGGTNYNVGLYFKVEI